MRENNAWFLLAKPVKSRVREGYKKAFFGKGKKLIDFNVFIFRTV